MGMKTRLGMIGAFFLLGSMTVWTQRAPRTPAAEEEVRVTLSATLQVTISSDVVGVFNYLADGKKLIQWFPDQAIIEPKLGGRYHFRWKDAAGVWSGVVTQFIRGNTLAYTWRPPGEQYETNICFKAFPQGAETMLELVHTGFTSLAAQEKAVKAWTFYLQNLKSVIEQGSDLREQPRWKSSRRRLP